MQQQNGRFRRLAPRTLRFDVVESIRAAVLDGTLPAGSPLVEARIAEEMGISRAPVREALRKLEQEGLVISIPYKGTYVTQVTPEAMLEIASLRTMLEAFAVGRALPRLRAGGFEQLKGFVADMRTAAARQDPTLMVEAHLNFHRTPYEMADNTLMLQFWRIMEGQIGLYLRVNHLTFGTLEEIADSHEQFVGILETGDLDAIKAHIVQHVEQAAERLVRGQRTHGSTSPSRERPAAPRGRQEGNLVPGAQHPFPLARLPVDEG